MSAQPGAPLVEKFALCHVGWRGTWTTILCRNWRVLGILLFVVLFVFSGARGKGPEDPITWAVASILPFTTYVPTYVCQGQWEQLVSVLVFAVTFGDTL